MQHRSMTKTELREFKDMLLERTRLLKGDLAGLEEETRGSGSEGAGRESSAPGHTAELASDESERDLSYGRMASQTEELKETFQHVRKGPPPVPKKTGGVDVDLD